VKPFCKSKKRYQKLLEAHVAELSHCNNCTNASHRYALLLIFQGMDAGGKEGAIRTSCPGSIPRRGDVSFKQPTATSWIMIFLWPDDTTSAGTRADRHFHRSYYEEVLVVRVHPEILRKPGLPEELLTKNIWKERKSVHHGFGAAPASQRHTVVKFFPAPVKREEQPQRIFWTH